MHFFKNPLTKIEKNPQIPWSVFTGALGLAGMTAYSGLKIFAAEKLKTVSDAQSLPRCLAHLIRRARSCS